MLPLTQGLMSLGAGGGGGLSATYDPAQVSAPAVLSNGNLRLTANPAATGVYANTRSTRALQGLAYISSLIGNAGAGASYGFGVADSTWGVANASVYCGGSGSNSIGIWGPVGNVYFNNAVIATVGFGSAPFSIEVAVRVASRRVWIRRAGGAWAGGGDPAADTSPTATLSGTGAIFAAASVTRAGSSVSWFSELHPDAATTTGTPPSGFTPANWVP